MGETIYTEITTGGKGRESQPDGCSDVAVSALGRSAPPTRRQSVFVPIDVNLRR